jgi:hypothetical protein
MGDISKEVATTEALQKKVRHCYRKPRLLSLGILIYVCKKRIKLTNEVFFHHFLQEFQIVLKLRVEPLKSRIH